MISPDRRESQPAELSRENARAVVKVAFQHYVGAEPTADEVQHAEFLKRLYAELWEMSISQVSIPLELHALRLLLTEHLAEEIEKSFRYTAMHNQYDLEAEPEFYLTLYESSLIIRGHDAKLLKSVGQPMSLTDRGRAANVLRRYMTYFPEKSVDEMSFELYALALRHLVAVA